MKIAILAPFNPSCICNYLDNCRDSIIDINANASAVNNIAIGLLKYGQEVTIITLDPSSRSNRILRGDRVTVHLIGNKPLFKFLLFFPLFSYECNKLRMCLRGVVDDVDVIHAHWAYQYANACLPFAKKKVVCCTYRDWPYAIVDNLSKRPFLYYVIKRFLWSKRIKMSNNILKTESVHLIANSDYMYSFLYNATHDKKRVNTIYNSIRDDVILKEQLYVDINYTFVAIAASLDDERKNILSLVKAFQIINKEYPSSKLYLIGPYHHNRSLYQYVLSEDLHQSIRFTGALSHNDVIDIIDKSLCLVHPSKEESFGNTLIEAMARCKPVIGGEKSGAVPFVLDFGNCGFLCDVDSIESIAAAMRKVIKDDKDRKRVVSNATNHLLTNYSNSASVKKHLELYQSLVNECNK